MSLAQTLRLHYADKPATWSETGATWTENGAAHLLVAIDGPLGADALIDAHLQALATNARVIVAHAGAPTPVAQRTAARFGITLLDASTLAPLAPAPGPSPSPEASGPAPLVDDIVRAWADATAAIARREAEPAPGPAPPAPEVPFPGPGGLAPTAEAAPVGQAEVVPALPWAISAPAAEPEAAHVEAIELAAMPWHQHDDQHELLPAGREARFAPARPTAMAPDWGLPWPRPVAPTGGLSIQDPTMWHAQERIQAVRKDLDALGAPSFGAVKPDGSTWLKRLSEFP